MTPKGKRRAKYDPEPIMLIGHLGAAKFITWKGTDVELNSRLVIEIPT
jgi:hypothetical protein